MMNPIGVFDSGIGGLSILKCLREALPYESFVYYADSAHNPYGDKTDAEVIERSLWIADHLIQKHQIKALVVACNTATAAAIHLLRARYPNLPLVGIEPALKPSIAATKTGRIAVLATRSTLSSEKFLTLKSSFNGLAEFICTPCIGLANMIERYAAGEATDDAVCNACSDFLVSTGVFGNRAGEIDTLVLGCTHYALIEPLFRQLLGRDIQIVDNGTAVAKRLTSLLTTSTTPNKTSTVTLISSGNSLLVKQAASRWLSH